MDNIVENNVKKYMSSLDDFCRILNINHEDVMVTGSIALYKQGMLPKGRLVHDLDIVIRCDEKLENVFTAFAKLNNNNFFKQHEDYMEGITHKPYIFPFDDIQYNIWAMKKESDFDTELQLKEGYYVATVGHILDVKKMYNRPKDNEDILGIAQIVIKK